MSSRLSVFAAWFRWAVWGGLILGCMAMDSDSISATEAPAPPESEKEPFAASCIKDGKLDLDAAVKYFEDIYRSTSSIAELELVISKPRRTRTLKMKVWTKGQDKALIVIQSPVREKGIATLKVAKNLWNYLPKIKRTIRIPPSMMLASWMGSDFTNDDLVRETSFSEDYNYTLVGPSAQPDGWLIRFDAKEGIVGLWKRFELVVSPDGRLPLEARYYDRKGRLSRKIVWDRVRDFGKRRIPSRLTLVQLDRKQNQGEKDVKEPAFKQKTEMIYHKIDFDVNVPERTFSLSQLESKR